MRLITSLACTLLAGFVPAVSSQETGKAPADGPIALNLKVLTPEIKRGAAPEFQLSLKNSTEKTQKVLNVPKRRDLLETYFALRITRDGEAVQLSRAISDPGPIDEGAYVSLAPGRTVTFDLPKYAIAFDELRPGKYKASIRFWQDPYQSHKTAYCSPEVEFIVKE